MAITIKSPQDGFLAIIPVAGCGHCPFKKDGCRCGHDYALDHAPRGNAYLYEHAHSNGTHPAWCPAIAESSDQPALSDLDFLLNDGVWSVKNAPSQ